MCDCDYCVRTRKFKEALARVKNDEDKKLFEHVYHLLGMVESELECAQAVLNGSWPSAVEQLRCALAGAIRIRTERGEELIDTDGFFETIKDSELAIGI